MKATRSAHWRLDTDDAHIAWLCLDKADSTTNVLSAEVLEDLDALLEVLERTPPEGLVIHSGKANGFIAGADVREFTHLSDRDEALILIRRGQAVFDRLAQLPFPTVAMIHGFCVGGGLELALACRYRVARDDPGTRLGLPEVRLGIHPGFGGSVRLPPRVGAPAALDLMLTGRTVSGRQARRLGLVEHAVPQRHLRDAARAVLAAPPAPRRPPWFARLAGTGIARPLVSRFLERKVAAKAPRAHYPAPYALLALWRDHGGDPRAMMAAEAASVAELITGPTSRNLVRAFLLQDHLKGLGKEAPADVSHVHVVGAGTMGGDIAAWCALRGFTVSLQDQSPARIAPAMARAWTLFRHKLKDERLARAAFDRLLPDHRGNALPRADLVIEAVFEDLAVKQDLYRDLEPRMKPTALLATNTSSIPLEELATALAEPARLVGLHFFNPVPKMQLVEVVRGKSTGDEVYQRALAFTHAIDRLPLPVASTPGFLVNRILMPYLLEAVQLVEDGVPAAAVDRAARDFGMPMGPVELADTVGLDVCLHVAQILTAHLGGTVPERLRTLVAQGRLGRKTGQGFYTYRRGRLLAQRLKPGYHLPPDLTDRLVLRLLNEAVACLREEVVADADLLDAGMIYGTGFAPFLGGPMHYLRDQGTQALRDRLAGLEERHGARFAAQPGWGGL